MSEQSAFWLVWNPRGRSPEFRHGSYAGARAEAERLAIEVGGEFFVLRAECSFKRSTVIVTELNPDIPF